VVILCTCTRVFIKGMHSLHSVACFRMSGAVLLIADLSSWPAKGQVCLRRDVIPVFLLTILRLFNPYHPAKVENMASS
jgi:hypothetical protein